MKRHLTIKGGRSACGQAGHLRSRRPSEVTCDGCRRTLHMATAEILTNQRATTQR